jgi:tetratricopeptide (TPR) repeat protein
VTIKGTLETFNLLDLLQMLSFNQKVGTLVLETANGPRTLFVEGGSFGFVEGDPRASRAFGRAMRRTGAVPAARLERALSITQNSGKFVGDVLVDLGALEGDKRNGTWLECLIELFFDLLQTAITRFEFVEGKRLAPDGKESPAIEPLGATDGVLLELTRKLDEWSVLQREVGSEEEVFEATEVNPDPFELAKDPAHVAERVLPLLNGTRNITQLVEESDCDRFAVMKLIAMLLKQGAVRAVDTESLVARAEDLLARGAANEAVPLLRRALDRGESPSRTRVRLADALEAAGDAPAAAAELDTYAAANEAADPVGVFDALQRAMRIRGGDGATAARICDHYLRHRYRLSDRMSDANDALRRLIHGATSSGRPIEAASRLAQFLDHGDAPGEDLLVLADLYASGGKVTEASAALIRRAEEHLTAGRSAPARDLFRRALAYDPTRLDARRRISDLEGEDRRRRHRRRMVLLLSLLGLTVGTASVVYLVYDHRAAHRMEETVARADKVTQAAEEDLAKALAAWNAAMAAACCDQVREGALLPAQAALKSETDRVAQNVRASLLATQADLSGIEGSHHGDTGIDRLHGLEVRLRALLVRAESASKEAADRAERALVAGEKAFADGRFREARPLLIQAVNLSLDSPERATRAKQRIEQVDEYALSFQKERDELDDVVARIDVAAKRDDGDEAQELTEKAWRLAAKIFATHLDSDLTHDVKLPVPVGTEPQGASLHLGSTAIPPSTPTLLRYSPFGALDLHLRSPGRAPVTIKLPSYRDVLDAQRAGHTKPFRVEVELPEGPRWTTTPPGGLLAGPFVADDAAWLVVGDGRKVMTVRASDGEAAEARGLGRLVDDRVRALGRGGGGKWLLVGQRTFAFQSDSGAAWSVQTVGRLERAPAFAGGLAIVADETGMVHAIDLGSGGVRWRKQMSFAPSQPPHVSPLGFLVGTIGGEAAILQPGTGEMRAVASPDPTRPGFLVPWKDGALHVGGPGSGIAVVDDKHRRTETASASPDVSITACVTASGVAWVEKDGTVRWLSKDDPKSPAVVSGVGTTAFSPAVAGGFVYVVGKDGVVRAAAVAKPSVTAWTMKLKSVARSEPVVLADLVLVRTDAGLVAIER